MTFPKTGGLSIAGADWLVDQNLQDVMTAFEAEGFKIYAVGGCVRDAALGRPVKDVDLSTNARPEQTTRIIGNLGSQADSWKAVPTGLEHGTITAVPAKGGQPYEITTFRKDVETDGRHAVVAFSDHIEEDAARRDFTVNAFYADRHGTVLDVVGGRADLENRHIRFIGDPAERIQEDYLRILRFFRFTGSHGESDEGVDADGLAACAMYADGLEAVSRERIGMEFTRILANPDAAPIVGMMEQSGVLGRILPGGGVATLARLIDLEEQYPLPDALDVRDLATRLAAVGCEDVSDRLRLTKAQAAKVSLVLEQAGQATPAYELAYRFGYWSALHCLLLRWASVLHPFDSAVLSQLSKGATAKFPIVAADLMPAYSGKSLGDRLKALEAAWIASEFELRKDELLDLS